MDLRIRVVDAVTRRPVTGPVRLRRATPERLRQYQEGYVSRVSTATGRPAAGLELVVEEVPERTVHDPEDRALAEALAGAR